MSPTILASTAGTFYPADPGTLSKTVRGFIAAASAPTGRVPKAIIAPHAGYDYSGPVAGSAYAYVQRGADSIRRVVLLGTCHVRGVRGLATTSAERMTTPLGQVPVDRAAVEELLRDGKGQIVVDDEAHAVDHSLQVQLPFLQVALDKFSIAPCLVGEVDDDTVEAAIAAFATDPATLTVVSSDLSHFHDAETAGRIDRGTADAIVDLNGDGLGREDACGFRAIRGLITVAKDCGWTAELIDLRNSGDTSGRRDRVVGYGALVFG